MAADELSPIMAPPVPYDELARVYALVDPAIVFDVREVVLRAIYSALGMQPSSDRRVTIAQSCGWIDFSDGAELWHRRAPPALPTRADALRTAELLLSRLEKACSPANPDWPGVLRGVSLLPPVGLLRRDSARAVARPDGSAWDHWLYRAEPRLLLDGSGRTKAGVYGAQVEVRIGHLGRVVGLSSRWRPLSGDRRLAERTPYVPPEGEDRDEQGDGHHDQPPILNFVLEGDGIPQFYLAPYYIATDGHSVTLTGATKWSLVVDIGRTRQDGGAMTLTALAQGGSGDYRYNWAVCSLADSMGSFRELGAGSTRLVPTRDGPAIASSVEVPNGQYIAMLNVKDRKTGAFKHHQQHVYSSPFPSTLGGALVA